MTMNSIDMLVTRETEDDSRDYLVTAWVDHDEYGIAVKLTPASAALVGKMTELEYDMALEAVRERDGEE